MCMCGFVYGGRGPRAQPAVRTGVGGGGGGRIHCVCTQNVPEAWNSLTSLRGERGREGRGGRGVEERRWEYYF